MRKIMITGGAGFVGRHFTRHFLEAGDEVHVVDSIERYTGGIDPADGWPIFDPRDHKNFKFKKVDCRDYFKRPQDTEFDYALHLAAMVGGRSMIENNPLVVADDLAIDANYWQWAKLAKPKKTICFSSSAAYPIKLQRANHYVLLREDMIDFNDDLGMPDMSYGWAKLTSEYLGRLAYERHGLKSVAYRPFSGYGEDQDDTYPFPSICKRAIAHRGEPELLVWGTGTQMRDFIHIDDCVRGVISTMDKIDDGGAINLSTGIFTSFLDFARLAAELVGYHPVVRGMSDMPVGVHARAGDTKKQNALGFKYATEFREGVARGIEYWVDGRRRTFVPATAPSSSPARASTPSCATNSSRGSYSRPRAKQSAHRALATRRPSE
jgi:nucleoside-diphosphate-sugar epimerase